MINLLPEANKNELRAARMNVLLLRYNVMTLIAVGILLLAVAGFYAYLAGTKASAETANAENEAKASSYADTKKEAAEYRANLATAKQILSNEVIYSTTVFGITELLPKGVILDSINLSSQDVGNQTVLKTYATDYDAVARLKQSFERSKLFSDVHFQSITVQKSEEGKPNKYKLEVNISVKMNKVEK